MSTIGAEVEGRLSRVGKRCCSDAIASIHKLVSRVVTAGKEIEGREKRDKNFQCRGITVKYSTTIDRSLVLL